MSKAERPFLPAAGRDWLLPLYDPFAKLFGFDEVRRALLAQADLRPEHRVLDVGCGTGTLAVLIKQLHPAVEVVGVDPDPKALARANEKARRASVDVRFDRGYADGLGYPAQAFDRVFSSMMFHHLEPGSKEPSLREMRRILRPGGRLHLLDFSSQDAGGHGLLGRLIHSHHRLDDNRDGRMLRLMSEAGFAEPKQLGERRLLFGRVAFFQAVAPWVRG